MLWWRLVAKTLGKTVKACIFLFLLNLTEDLLFCLRPGDNESRVFSTKAYASFVSLPIQSFAYRCWHCACLHWDLNLTLRFTSHNKTSVKGVKQNLKKHTQQDDSHRLQRAGSTCRFVARRWVCPIGALDTRTGLDPPAAGAPVWERWPGPETLSLEDKAEGKGVRWMLIQTVISQVGLRRAGWGKMSWN